MEAGGRAGEWQLTFDLIFDPIDLFFDLGVFVKVFVLVEFLFFTSSRARIDTE